MLESLLSTRIPVAASVALLLAAAPPSFAQGKSQQAHGHASPPSRSTLPPPTAIGATAGTTPFAWVDDASLLSPGDVWFGVSMLRWQGAGVSEVDAPVVDAAVGLSPRLQLGVSAPRVVGSSDPGGVEGGLGTTYIHGKVAVFHGSQHGLKVAVAPTLEILGHNALLVAPADQNRLRWGVPVSAQIDMGEGRVYGSTGYFSRGVWFLGAGAALPVTTKIGASASFSRSWSSSASVDPAIAAPSRNELSGGASYAVSPAVAVFGSIGHTLATADADGAGATLSAGVAFLLRSVAVKN